jgi:hypothetical protein
VARHLDLLRGLVFRLLGLVLLLAFLLVVLLVVFSGGFRYQLLKRSFGELVIRITLGLCSLLAGIGI